MSHKQLAELITNTKSLFLEIESEKTEEHIREQLVKATADPMEPYRSLKWYPRYVVWELTLACNMRCGHCGSVAGVKRSDELSLEEMLHVADELGELECERLTLLGGEPLIHPHWEKVAQRLKENNVRVNVITNGWILQEGDVCDRIKQAGLTIVGISIDGLQASHDKLRREGSFARILKGLDALRERQIPIAVCTVITTDSLPDLPQLYDLFLDKGVKVWQLQIASPLGRLERTDPLLIKPAQIKQIYDFFYAKKKLGNKMHIDLADDIGYYPSWEQGYARSSRKESSFWTGCHAGLQVLGIDSNGDIKGCQSLPSTPEFIEGNVKTRSLKEIWHKPDGFVYNRQFKLEQLRGYCGECRHAPLCKAGCTSSALAFSGHTGDNPMCVYRAEQTIRVTS